MGGLAACTPPPKGDKAIPFENLTIDNLARFPDGREFIVVTGQGYPPEGEKDPEARRKGALNGATVAAQEKLIVELKKVVAKGKIRDLLRQAEVGKVDYAYDDICTLTLKLPKELLSEKVQEW
ncbi:MAG: hypothetical protein HY554_18460 [Elusimicrobia bacterium]|nr:hypothetical protein [Elusimicrobiota bacterium]